MFQRTCRVPSKHLLLVESCRVFVQAVYVPNLGGLASSTVTPILQEEFLTQPSATSDGGKGTSKQVNGVTEPPAHVMHSRFGRCIRIAPFLYLRLSEGGECRSPFFGAGSLTLECMAIMTGGLRDTS